MEMIDRICELHPEGSDYHGTKVLVCEEFIKTLGSLQGIDLEPYLAGMSCTPGDGCFNITFKFPLISYNELTDLRLRKKRARAEGSME